MDWEKRGWFSFSWVESYARMKVLMKVLDIDGFVL
jgi:hypothetical protein